MTKIDVVLVGPRNDVFLSSPTDCMYSTYLLYPSHVAVLLAGTKMGATFLLTFLPVASLFAILLVRFSQTSRLGIEASAFDCTSQKTAPNIMKKRLLLVVLLAFTSSIELRAFEPTPPPKDSFPNNSAMKAFSKAGTFRSSHSELAVISEVPDMLSKMALYFDSMVDPRTNRFFYRVLPNKGGLKTHEHCPIRDLGSAWDTTNLLRHNLDFCQMYPLLPAAVTSTIDAYSSSFVTFRASNESSRQCAALPFKVLREPSNIAHSAFLLLSMIGAIRLNLIDPSRSTIPLNNLVNGILSQQVENGAFAIRFGFTDVLSGIEFYPGEALLALLDAYETSDVLSPSTRNDILSAAKKAFLFYSEFYSEGHVDVRYASFFGNWQVQCFAKLVDALRKQQGARSETANNDGSAQPTPNDLVTGVTEAKVVRYIMDLCDAIVRSPPWKQLDRGVYSQISTVEIACGLEALVEGTRLATTLLDKPNYRPKLYWHHVQNAVRFLGFVQDQVPQNTAGYGGLGFSLDVPEQRLDVTGHALNALIGISRLQPESPTTRTT